MERILIIFLIQVFKVIRKPYFHEKYILEIQDLTFNLNGIPKRKMYYTFKKGGNMKWPLIITIFWQIFGMYECISITDHNRPVKVMYYLDPIMHQV
jgi:hypothetical protein